jgi:hypothetical protein
MLPIHLHLGLPRGLFPSGVPRLPQTCYMPTSADRVPRGQRDGSLRPYSRFSRQEPLLFYQVAPQLYSRG